MIADFAEYRANYEFSSGGLASAQRLDVKLRAAGRRPASSGAPLAAHPIMPVQVARRRANSRRRSRLGRREKQRRTVNFNDELCRASCGVHTMCIYLTRIEFRMGRGEAAREPGEAQGRICGCRHLL